MAWTLRYAASAARAIRKLDPASPPPGPSRRREAGRGAGTRQASAADAEGTAVVAHRRLSNRLSSGREPGGDPGRRPGPSPRRIREAEQELEVGLELGPRARRRTDRSEQIREGQELQNEAEEGRTPPFRLLLVAFQKHRQLTPIQPHGAAIRTHIDGDAILLLRFHQCCARARTARRVARVGSVGPTRLPDRQFPTLGWRLEERLEVRRFHPHSVALRADAESSGPATRLSSGVESRGHLASATTEAS